MKLIFRRVERFQLLKHRGLDVSGTDTVEPDAFRCVLYRQRPDQGDQRPLRRGIHRIARNAEFCRNGSDSDNRKTVSMSSLAENLLAYRPEDIEVNLHQLMQILQRRRAEWERPLQPGAVDESGD